MLASASGALKSGNRQAAVPERAEMV